MKIEKLILAICMQRGRAIVAAAVFAGERLLMMIGCYRYK
jgi:hypothetical protein